MEQSHPLEISSEHLIYSHKNAAKNAVTLVPAGDLQVGDSLLTRDGNPTEILWIRKVERRGAYSPLTGSGNVLVNGVLASSYVSRNWLKNYVSGDILHLFQHGAILPVHIFCSLVNCQQESYNKTTGFSAWVQFWFTVEQWQLSLPKVWQVVFLSVLAVPATMLTLLGKLLVISPTKSLATHAIDAIIGFFLWKQQQQPQKKRKRGAEHL